MKNQLTMSINKTKYILRHHIFNYNTVSLPKITLFLHNKIIINSYIAY